MASYGRNYTPDAYRYHDARRDLNQVRSKVSAVDEKLTAMDQDWRGVPQRVGGMEENLVQRTEDVNDLKYRSDLHDKQIHLLQKEVDQLNLENAVYKDRMHTDRAAERDTDRRWEGGRETGANDDNYGQPEVYRPEPEVSAPSPHRPSAPAYLRNSSSHGRPEDRPVPVRRERIHVGMERYQNFDSSLISAHPSKIPKAYFEEQKQQWLVPAKPVDFGGFVFMRFQDSGYRVVSLALTKYHSILRNCKGVLCGVARKDGIRVMDSPVAQGGWAFIRRPEDDRTPYRMTDNAVAVMCFNNEPSAEHFFNAFHNHSTDPNFPTGRGFEMLYLPTNCALNESYSPSSKPAQTSRARTVYQVMELMDAYRYAPTSLKDFEDELCDAIIQLVPDAMPCVVSTKRRNCFTSGNMLNGGSKVYINLFYAQDDADYVHKSGTLYKLMDKWDFNSPVQVFSLKI